MPLPADIKLCECGCGKPAPIVSQTNVRQGRVKGQPGRFIHNHHRRIHEAHSATVHEHLRKTYPKTGVCERCKKERKTDWAFKRHPDPYTRDIKDYEELCRGCHLKQPGHGRRSHAHSC